MTVFVEKIRRWSLVLAINLLIFLLLAGLAVLSGGIWLALLNSNNALGKSLVEVPFLNRLAVEFYHDRMSMIQWMPGCARYDPALVYTLRPGSCVFSNPEFSVRVDVNSAGLRDDEASLSSPEMIVVGDSHAMGWGVEQDESFAEVVERSGAGLRVLNAAVSSYGTVREMMILSRLDTSNLKYLVVQYNENDLRENEAYYADSRLPVISRREYEYISARHSATRKSDFKYDLAFAWRFLRDSTAGLIKKAARAGRGRDAPGGYGAAYEAALFINALNSAAVDLGGVHLIILESNDYNSNDTGFTESVSAKIRAGALSKRVRKVSLLDLSSVLGPGDHFILDGHLNRSGHRKIAGLILKTIGRSSPDTETAHP